MAYLVKAPRVGRSQGAVIFWGLVSVFFATAFCYYYLKNRTNEESARTLQDQVMTLQEERDSLSSQRDKIQAAATETEKQLKTREEFLQDKETKLATEETRLESMGAQSLNQSQQKQAQAAGVKTFDDAVRKLVAKTKDADVVVRGGRPVLRAPSSIFFAYGEAQLLPEGRATLTQIAQALDGKIDNFEVRVETFTDSDGETAKPDATAPPAPGDKKPEAAGKPSATAAAKPKYATSWDLTAARAGAIARFLREQSPLPFQNVLAMGRADFQPIVANTKEGHAHNRRVEITITPLPVGFHPADTGLGRGAKPAATSHPLQPPPDGPARYNP